MMRWVGAGVAEMMVALRLDRNQTIPSALGELRVRLEHVDGEGDLIDHALSGTVTAGKQFEVTEGVIAPVAIDVVDSLVARQFAPQVLLHDEPVLEDGFLATSNTRRNGDTPVPVTRFMAREYPTVFNRIFEASSSRRPLMFRFASLVTKLLLPVVDGTTGFVFVPFHRLDFPAMKTRERCGRFGSITLSCGGTRDRTVRRIFSVLSDVFPQICGLKRECTSTMLACQNHGFDLGCRSPVNSLMRLLAIAPAELSRQFPASSDVEGVPAVNTHKVRVRFLAFGLCASIAAKTLMGLRGAYQKYSPASFTMFLDRHISALQVWFQGIECHAGNLMSTEMEA